MLLGLRVAEEPLQVTKLNSLGQPIWQKELRETVVQEGKRTGSCVAALTVLTNGDPLVACVIAKDNTITLFQLSSQTGASARRSIQLPSPPSNCDEWLSPVHFMRQTADGGVWIFGSPSPGVQNCTWLGQISQTHLPRAQ